MFDCLKKIAIAFALCTTSAFGANDSFFHMDVGVGPLPIPAPELSFGWRHQRMNKGWDASASASSLLVASKLEARGVYLYYPQPSTDQQWYLGIGGSVAMSWSIGYPRDPLERITISPQWLIGKERRMKSGLISITQLRISCPTLLANGKDGFWFPMTILSYGFSF